MKFNKNDDYNKILGNLQELTDLPLYGKLVFRPSSIKELKKMLSNVNKLKSYILTLESTDKDILSFAAKDTRIDVISIDTPLLFSNISEGILSLIKQFKKYIDVSLYYSFGVNNYERSKFFREFSKIIYFIRKNPSFVLYSGIESSNYYIRGPRAIISILNSIFELPLIKCKYLLRDNPQNLLEKIEERSNESFIINGVKIIERIKRQKNKLVNN